MRRFPDWSERCPDAPSKSMKSSQENSASVLIVVKTGEIFICCGPVTSSPSCWRKTMISLSAAWGDLLLPIHSINKISVRIDYHTMILCWWKENLMKKWWWKEKLNWPDDLQNILNGCYIGLSVCRITPQILAQKIIPKILRTRAMAKQPDRSHSLAIWLRWHPRQQA